MAGGDYQYWIQLKCWQEISTGSLRLSDFSPTFSPQKIEIIGLLVLISVVLVIYNSIAQHLTPALCVRYFLVPSDLTTLFQFWIISTQCLWHKNIPGKHWNMYLPMYFSSRVNLQFKGPNTQCIFMYWRTFKHTWCGYTRSQLPNTHQNIGSSLQRIL